MPAGARDDSRGRQVVWRFEGAVRDADEQMLTPARRRLAAARGTAPIRGSVARGAFSQIGALRFAESGPFPDTVAPESKKRDGHGGSSLSLRRLWGAQPARQAPTLARSR